ncbi:hypothetical protein [Actibacterium pelagium]|uniref:Uncharacterized protein n=1 Tax=Actibacterium pelagium TaxID=2029103 RepID=A0A917AH68_9RHOB|nr:hypothetical protein [Actibacterium pelagium]GGE51644.1 hypothetical protein GCM10011517_19220 [Actibacterium pelagium]
MLTFQNTALAGLLIGVSVTAAGSQVQIQNVENFASENAILDTSILFAIGAREARQELRGAFGWPTFQEGLVDGVYFRFDPDGYARFSPNPRLDTDVFEVVCRPRTYSCMGRKGTLSYMLNSRGELQIRLENAAEGDRFFVVEGISELEVPARILQPLDDRMETLLSSSDELIIRRGQDEVDRVSLVGFGAVSAYLRWISARQDYTVLPRGWPIPNGANGATDANLTQAANWQSPMPQPQTPIQTVDTGVDAEMAEVKGELNVLRELLLERHSQNSVSTQPVASPVQSPSQEALRIVELERNAAELQAELERLRSAAQPPNQEALGHKTEMFPAAPSVVASATPAATQPEQASYPQAGTGPKAEAGTLAARLEYLMTEIGLDAKTALMIIEMGSEAEMDETETITPTTVAETYQNQLMNEILSELHKSVGPKPEQPTVEQTQLEPVSIAPTTLPPQDYVLLSDYFRSVFPQAQTSQ